MRTLSSIATLLASFSGNPLAFTSAPNAATEPSSAPNATTESTPAPNATTPAPSSTATPEPTSLGLDCTPARVNDNVDAIYSSITGANTMYSTIVCQSRVLAIRNISYQEPRCMQYLCLNASLMMFRAGDAFYGCQGQYPALSELTFMPRRTARTARCR